VRFGRFFRFKERARLELFFQAFDLSNRANFGTSYGGNIRTSTFEQPTGLQVTLRAKNPAMFVVLGSSTRTSWPPSVAPDHRPR